MPCAPFTPSWSLCVEEQFYLLAPWVVLFVVRGNRLLRGSSLAGALLIGGSLLRAYCWTHYFEPLRHSPGWPPSVAYFKDVYYPTYNRMDGLIMGVLLAVLRDFAPSQWERLRNQWPLPFLTGVAILAACVFLEWDSKSLAATIYGFPAISIGFGCLLVSASGAGCPVKGIPQRIPRALSAWPAALAYSLYLVHRPIIELTVPWGVSHGLDKQGLVLFLLVATLSVIASGALYLTVERPFLRLRTKLLG